MRGLEEFCWKENPYKKQSGPGPKDLLRDKNGNFADTTKGQGSYRLRKFKKKPKAPLKATVNHGTVVRSYWEGDLMPGRFYVVDLRRERDVWDDSMVFLTELRSEWRLPFPVYRDTLEVVSPLEVLAAQSD